MKILESKFSEFFATTMEDFTKVNKVQMEKQGYSKEQILEAELEAAFEIIESLPVDAHDMEVHFWCLNCEEEEDGNTLY